MRSAWEPFALLWWHRRLLLQTVRNDIRARYAGSILGLTWLFFYPLLFLGAYAVVYIFIFKIRFALFNSNEYVALIFCGLVPFLGFSEALSTGVGSVTSNANLIKNTLFPIDLIPIKSVMTSQCTQAVGMGMLIIVITLLGKLTFWIFMLPIIWLLQVIFTIGVIWILSSLNVYLRDLQNIVSVFILLLMMVSPIAYTADMVPENLRAFLGLNPMYYMIVAYQDCLMLGRFPREGVLGLLLVMALVSFRGGYWFFSRMKEVFADNV
jgi:lipopolysaccharide transport system permease protein